MKYVIIAVCIAIIVISFAAVIKNIIEQLHGKCCCDCSKCQKHCSNRTKIQ